MDQAAEPVSTRNTRTGRIGERLCATSGRMLLQVPARPVIAVMIDVIA
jgi:hypothetical protein